MSKLNQCLRTVSNNKCNMIFMSKVEQIYKNLFFSIIICKFL